MRRGSSDSSNGSQLTAAGRARGWVQRRRKTRMRRRVAGRMTGERLKRLSSGINRGRGRKPQYLHGP
jgi:hypothetical protein